MQTPTAKWNASVLAFNINQKCDWYCFVGCLMIIKYLIYMVLKKKMIFIKKLHLVRKMEIDPNGSGNNWTFREILIIYQLKI